MSLRWCLLVWIGLIPLLTAGTFEEKVLPILKSNCLPCHDERTRTSGFSITSPESIMAGGSRRGQAVKTGLPAQSNLVPLPRGQLTPQMALGKRVPDTGIAVIQKGIRE